MTAGLQESNIHLQMKFRSRIFVIIFIVGLLPALIILAAASYLLNSTLNRIGASGLESSLALAESMAADAESMAGQTLRDKLRSVPLIPDRTSLSEWLKTEKADIVFIQSPESGLLVFSDSLRLTADTIPGDLPSAAGTWRWYYKERAFLIHAVGRSRYMIGCGILLPPDYAENGRLLAEAVSTSASLSIYKAFSLRLLTVLTVASIFLALAAGLILSVFISRQLTHPLAKLTSGARLLGAGDLQGRVKLGGKDEFSDLADSFNTMADRIVENQQRLLTAERLAAWREVARRIAHEIRNPLTPITIELYRLEEMAQKGDIPGDKAVDLLAAIRIQIQALNDLSGQFSTFAREPQLKRVRCSLEDILNKSLLLYRDRKNVTINTAIPDHLPLLDLDPLMMGRVFGNLIKNSVEVADKVSIEITAEKTDNAIRVIFRDNGPGYPAEKLEKIDQPYITGKKTGTGLGLIIVKKIIEEHGGEVRFYNDGGAAAEILLRD